MKVFIGYDSREDIAYQICKYSIQEKNQNIEVEPLVQKNLRKAKIYNRPIDALASTEFTFTRFLVPQLMNFNGWALFCDCDIVFLEDVQKLFDQANDKYAVMCAKHDYNPQQTVKMDGKRQTLYPRKNWSSVVLFNCNHPSNRVLTSDLVNEQSLNGAYFHRFSWLKDEEIGEFSHEWNWLAGWYEEPKDGSPKAIHYTEGGPWFEDYVNCEYADVWNKFKDRYEDSTIYSKKNLEQNH